MVAPVLLPSRLPCIGLCMNMSNSHPPLMHTCWQVRLRQLTAGSAAIHCRKQCLSLAKVCVDLVVLQQGPTLENFYQKEVVHRNAG